VSSASQCSVPKGLFTASDATEPNWTATVQFSSVASPAVRWFCNDVQQKSPVVASRCRFLQIKNWQRSLRAVAVQFSCIARCKMIVAGCCKQFSVATQLHNHSSQSAIMRAWRNSWRDVAHFLLFHKLIICSICIIVNNYVEIEQTQSSGIGGSSSHIASATAKTKETIVGEARTELTIGPPSACCWIFKTFSYFFAIEKSRSGSSYILLQYLESESIDSMNCRGQS